MKLDVYTRRFLGLPPADRLLFMQAELLFVLTWASLRIVGFRRWQTLLSRLATRHRVRDSVADVPSSTLRTVSLVRAAARHTLGTPTCLSQSLVCWTLLRRQGIEGDLRIGTRRENGKFEAHAWVEYQGQVVNDRPDVGQRYAAFNQPIDAAHFIG